MIKLIATDIDGTLVKDGTLMINPEYMTVIEQLTQKGILLHRITVLQKMEAARCSTG